MLSRLLRNAGYTVSEADNGQQAVEMVTNAGPFDLIFMDFEMPVMDGPTATKALRAMNCTTPVVGITGNTLPGDVKHFLSAGAQEVLPKPLTLASLNAMVSKLATACEKSHL